MEKKAFQVSIPCGLNCLPTTFREKQFRFCQHVKLILNMLGGILKFLLCLSHAPPLN